ncbi:hypothetical protein C8J56DRAFT_896357 [Mycena floridula]|nr:hypothetical protein C8J56DRAFT_896357 [Mycena floridula]
MRNHYEAYSHCPGELYEDLTPYNPSGSYRRSRLYSLILKPKGGKRGPADMNFRTSAHTAVTLFSAMKTSLSVISGSFETISRLILAVEGQEKVKEMMNIGPLGLPRTCSTNELSRPPMKNAVPTSGYPEINYLRSKWTSENSRFRIWLTNLRVVSRVPSRSTRSSYLCPYVIDLNGESSTEQAPIKATSANERWEIDHVMYPRWVVAQDRSLGSSPMMRHSSALLPEMRLDIALWLCRNEMLGIRPAPFGGRFWSGGYEYSYLEVPVCQMASNLEQFGKRPSSDAPRPSGHPESSGYVFLSFGSNLRDYNKYAVLHRVAICRVFPKVREEYPSLAPAPLPRKLGGSPEPRESRTGTLKTRSRFQRIWRLSKDRPFQWQQLQK